jgi:hypothetical protein
VPGRWDTTADPDLTDRIVARCRLAQPRLRDAAVIEVITGLRPDRPACGWKQNHSDLVCACTTTVTAVTE